MRSSLVVVVALVSACTDPCEQEPAYGGDGNDEVWRALVDGKDDATESEDGATITAPEAGDTFAPNDAPIEIAWDSPLELASVLPTPLFRARERTLFDLIVPRAHAHLPPVTSDAYLVEIEVPGRACPLQIVTTDEKHELDDESWSVLRGELSMQIFSAYLESGRITEGPYKSPAVKFSVK
jgi:hypothetical protein